MINCKEIFDYLQHRGIGFYAGVPDSLLKDFCAYLTDHADKNNHVIAANEGNAIAMATGYHLATNKFGLVYMQNSGEGNAINPLISLADPEVYSIPLLLMIGWRGEPGKHDEPQHVKQGKITLNLLDTMNIPYEILPDSMDSAKATLETTLAHLKDKKSPCALVIKKDTFEPYKLQNLVAANNGDYHYSLSREEALKLVINHLKESEVVVSTTGMLSRELFEYRERLNQGHHRDFLTVGSMGHSSSIALGIALSKPDRQVYCLDGDGAALMHMGSMGIIGQKHPHNFKHLIFNNGAHDSVGGQPTAGFEVDLKEIAKACGYNLSLRAENKKELEEKMLLLKQSEGPSLLEIRVSKGNRKDLGRPTTTPIQNKDAFMTFLSEEEND